MIRKTISVAVCDEQVLVDVLEKLRKELRDSVRIEMERTEDSVRAEIGFCDKDEDFVCASLRRVISTAVQSYYKEKSLLAALRLPILERQLYLALVSALVVFDRTYEKELIERVIPSFRHLDLDGLYRFRLQEVRSRWSEIAELAMDSLCSLQASTVCLELIRFLLSTCPFGCECLRITSGEQAYEISDGRNSVWVSPDELLSCVVRRNPRIVVAVEGESDPGIALIDTIFSRKSSEN